MQLHIVYIHYIYVYSIYNSDYTLHHIPISIASKPWQTLSNFAASSLASIVRCPSLPTSLPPPPPLLTHCLASTTRNVKTNWPTCLWRLANAAKTQRGITFSQDINQVVQSQLSQDNNNNCKMRGISGGVQLKGCIRDRSCSWLTGQGDKQTERQREREREIINGTTLMQLLHNYIAKTINIADAH